MERVNIATPVWQSKNGPISICDRENMPDEYLQNILNYSEHKYMEYNNRALTLASQIEKLEKQSEEAVDKSVIFRDLVKSIRIEAQRRGIEILSLADKNPDKFQILRNDFKLQNA